MIKGIRKGGIVATAIAAAVAMLGSLGIVGTANAADGDITADSTGSIVLNNVNPGVEAKVYKVIDVNFDYETQQPEHPEYTWNSAVAGWTKANYRQFVGDNNTVSDAYQQQADDLTAEPKNDGTPSSTLAAYYDQLASAIGDDDPVVTVPEQTVTAKFSDEKDDTVNGGKTATLTLGNVPMGGYLVVLSNPRQDSSEQNGQWVYRPFGVKVAPKWDATAKKWTIENATIDSKRSVAGIDKSVNEDNKDGHNSGAGTVDGNEGNGSDTVAIGDTVDFDLRSDVPVFPSNAIDKKYVIGDLMDKALTFRDSDAADLQVWGIDETGKTTALKGKGDDANYTLKYNNNDTDADGNYTDDSPVDLDGNHLTFLLDFNYETIRQYKKIHVHYTAQVNEKAEVGTPIPNTAKLQYTNNPYEKNSHRTIPDKVKLYTFGINVTKKGQHINDDGSVTEAGALTGAEFGLTKTGATAALPFVAIDRAKGEYRAWNAEKDAKNPNTTTTLTVGTEKGYEGKLVVKGIKNGEYQLTETKAPEGYNKLSTPIDVKLVPETDANGDFTGKLEQSKDGFEYLDVVNKNGRLPQTGGIGTIVFSVVGALLIAGGLLMINRKRRA